MLLDLVYNNIYDFEGHGKGLHDGEGGVAKTEINAELKKNNGFLFKSAKVTSSTTHILVATCNGITRKHR